MNLRPALAALLIAGSTASHAIAISPAPLSLTIERTATVDPVSGLNSTIDLARFDASLGTLTSVLVELHGVLNATAKMENKSSKAATLNAFTNGSWSLGLPTGSALLAITSTNTSFAASAYDHVTDYAGASGSTVTLSATADAARGYSTPAELAWFTGTDSLHLVLSGTGGGTVTSSGSVSGGVVTKTGATVSVTYTYALPVIATPTAAVPEPDTWALMAAGLGMVAMLAARRKKA